MIKPISFCIPTAKNEKEYITLLLNSLIKNTNIETHEIIIFVDSDNQNTTEFLIEKQKTLPNLKLIVNNYPYQTGTQINSSIMFNHAKHDIVCYLQSDMVVGKDLDIHISNNINDNRILSLTRIEPPLHPESEEKITMDLGISPEKFNSDKFNTVVDSIQSDNRDLLIDSYFAPFAIFKKTWFDLLNGFDTQFRCSREDSDLMVRAKLNNIELVQSWDAIVYHFTCVSSRGNNWYQNTEHVQYKNMLQQKADLQELIRFIRKWGKFDHKIDYFYEVSLYMDLDEYCDINVLLNIEPYFSKIYLNNSEIVDYLISTLRFTDSYTSNLRRGYTPEYWKSVTDNFNVFDFSSKILFINDIRDIDNKISISCKYSDFNKSFKDSINIIQSIQDTIHQTEIGKYEYGIFDLTIDNKINSIDNKKRVPVDLQKVIKSYKFEIL